MALADEVVVEFGVHLLLGELLQGVVEVEVLGDGDLLWAAFTTVVASGARNGDGIADDLCRLSDDALFLIVEGLI